MTALDFLEEFKSGLVVHCKDVYERRDVLMYLSENGLELKPIIEDMILKPERNGEYLYVAMQSRGYYPTCYWGTESFKNRVIISYAEYLERIGGVSSALSASADEIFALF